LKWRGGWTRRRKFGTEHFPAKRAAARVRRDVAEFHELAVPIEGADAAARVIKTGADAAGMQSVCATIAMGTWSTTF
jgi:hypothetical protein